MIKPDIVLLIRTQKQKQLLMKVKILLYQIHKNLLEKVRFGLLIQS